MIHQKGTSNMLKTGEVAHLLNVHINTVRRWSNRGILKAYRIGPRGDRRFRRQEVTGFLVELRTNQPDGEKDRFN